MASERRVSHAAVEDGAVEVVTMVTDPDQYEIVATATFACGPAEVWALLGDWERLIAVGLPGMTSDFEWLSGGPDQAPATFQFVLADALIKEEIYERSADEEAGRYRLRYRVLEPALGVLEYDAVVELRRVAEERTAFTATRAIRLEPGTPPDMLAGMVESETQRLMEHFAGNR